MAKQLKRKGKTFVTEHYVTPDLVEVFNKALVDFVPSTYPIHCPDELNVWADPAGILIKAIHAKWDMDCDLIPWKQFPSLNEQDIAFLLTGCDHVYNIHGVTKIRLNDTVMRDLKAMMEI